MPKRILIEREGTMAKVIENLEGGRRKILLSSYDVINVVRTYQYLVQRTKKYEKILDILREQSIYLPEDF